MPVDTLPPPPAGYTVKGDTSALPPPPAGYTVKSGATGDYVDQVSENLNKPLDWMDRLKFLGSVAASPIAGIANAPAEVWNWIKGGGHTPPSGGFMGEPNPVSEMLGNAAAVVAPAVAAEIPAILRNEGTAALKFTPSTGGGLRIPIPGLGVSVEPPNITPDIRGGIQRTITARAAPAVWQGQPAAPPARSPAPVEPIPSDLPSGRKPPSASERTSRASSPAERSAAPAAADPKTLDDIARGLGGKSYARMTAEEQAGVRQIVDRLNQPAPPAQRSPAAPAPAMAAAPQPAAPAPAAAAPLSQQVDAYLASRRSAAPQVTAPETPAQVQVAGAIPDNATPAQLGKMPAADVAKWLKMRGRGAAPTVPVPIEPAAPAAPPAAAIEPGQAVIPGQTVMLAGDEPAVFRNQKAAELAGQLADEMRKGGTEPAKPAAPAPQPTAAETTAANRVAKAQRFADAFRKAGVDPKDLRSVSTGYVSQSQIAQGMMPRWGNIAESLGEKEPSMTTVGEIIRRMETGTAGIAKSESGANVEPRPSNEQPTTNSGTGTEGTAVPGPRTGSGPAGSAAEGQGATAPQQPSASVGAPTRVRVPGETVSYPARYQLKELEDVQTSHNGHTFQENPRYKGTNDRDYSRAENQGKVVNWSTPAEFDPYYHITDNPDATNGPIVVDSEGNALGGNGRGMILQRVYAKNPQGAAAYRQLLEQKAPQFGFTAEQVRGMKNPVLVREIPDTGLPQPGARQNAITDFNKKGTAELRPAEKAIADSRRVSQGTLDDISTRLDAKGPEATLPEILEGKGGPQVMQRLINDGVVSPQERAAYISGDALTAEGKTRISKLMLGRFFRDPAQLDHISPALRNKLERIASPLARAEGEKGWSLTPQVREAIDLLEEAQSRGAKNLDDVTHQGGLFGDQKYSDQAVVLAKHLQGTNPNALTKAVRQYAQDAHHGTNGNALFGNGPTPESSFADAFVH